MGYVNIMSRYNRICQ